MAVASLLNPIPVHSLLELAPSRSPEWVRSGAPGTWKLLRLVMDVQLEDGKNKVGCEESQRVKKFNVATSLYNQPKEKKDLDLNSL